MPGKPGSPMAIHWENRRRRETPQARRPEIPDPDQGHAMADRDRY